MLLDLIEIARDEKANPPPLYAPPSPFRLTRIPAMLTRIGIAIDVFRSLGGPFLKEVDDLLKQGYGVGNDPMLIIGPTIDAPRAVNTRVQNDPALNLREGGAD